MDSYDAGATTKRGDQTRKALRDAAPRLSADQAETALSRLREGDFPEDDDTVRALLDRLEAAGGKRRANAARKWWGESGRQAQARADRQQSGTLAEQREEYGNYIADLAQQIESRGRGSGGVTRRVNGLQSRGDKGASLEAILTSSPATIRARLSDEALELLAEIGPPLSFDAWRHEFKGARDPDAVRSHQRRTGGFFSEYG